jgi:DEAD/DEAH box helicase domain-containing protein
MRIVTFDIETEGDFRTGGDFSNLELTVVGIHDSESNTYSSFLKSELTELWPILERTDILVGYNSDHFDIPILNRYYPGDLSRIKSIDLLKEIKNVLGRRLRLDSFAEGTLKKNKSGSGSQAQVWWKEGNFEKVRKYCLDDVRITRELYEYAKRHGGLIYKDFEGTREIKIDTSKWEAGGEGTAMTHTLPF